MFEGSHATHGFLVRAEPELHLRQHVLVHFLQGLQLLLLLRFLLVEILVGELLEVLRIDLLHDEVQAARCYEIADVAWIAR